MLDILIFALITLFFGYRIYVALGRTSSDDDGEEGLGHRVKRRGEEGGGFVTVGERVRGEKGFRRRGASDEEKEEVLLGREGEWESLVRNVDSGFDMLSFKVGARKAFVMILESFARGEREVLRGLTSPVVYEAFEVDMDAREEEGVEREVTILEMERVEVEDVRIEGDEVRLLVSFWSRQVIVERDGDQEVVEGSEDKELDLRDKWVFLRNVKSENAVWLLEETEVESSLSEN